MAQFHHHPDDLIYVRTLCGVYCDTTENFAADNNEPAPGLLRGVAQRLYDDQSKTHRLFDSFNNHVANDDVPWAFGDKAIANVMRLIAAKAARESVRKRPATLIRKVTP